VNAFATADDRLLKRATEVVADHVTTGYSITDAGDPSDPVIIQVLKDACCAQVEQWLEVGEENDIAGYPRAASVSVGGLNLSALPSVLAPRARRILRRGGLTVTVAW
jgi:hypothetical protein